MTPQMIVDCAIAKELDCIALTDHNISGNCLSAISYAQGKDLIVLPGMELQTSEEIHVICIFPDIERAVPFESYVRSTLPPIKNDIRYFGNQTGVRPDGTTYEEEQMLAVSSDIPLYGLYPLVESYGGMAIPAHIDRTSFSIGSVLGMLDKSMGFPLVEVWKDPSLADAAGIPYIQSSDAHNIDAFFEREYHSFIADEKSADGIFRALKNIGAK
jgi:PHP family Zn ribbon phosphoesterase